MSLLESLRALGAKLERTLALPVHPGYSDAERAAVERCKKGEVG